MQFNPYGERQSAFVNGVENDQNPSQEVQVNAPEAFTDAVDNGLGVTFGDRSVIDSLGNSLPTITADGSMGFNTSGTVASFGASPMYLTSGTGSGMLKGDTQATVTGARLVYREGLKLSGNSGTFQGLGYGAGVKSAVPEGFVQGESKIFGYVPRYSRWKWKNDVVCGQMRDSLEFWHTFRQFSQVPYISHSFVSYEDAGFVSDLNKTYPNCHSQPRIFY